jgi:hypothetical protein
MMSSEEQAERDWVEYLFDFDEERTKAVRRKKAEAAERRRRQIERRLEQADAHWNRV